MTGEGCVASVQWNAATDQYKWRRKKSISCMQLHSSRATCVSNVTHMPTCPCISDVSCRPRWLTVGSSSGWCRCWRTMTPSPTTRWSTPSLCWWTCACVHQVGKISVLTSERPLPMKYCPDEGPLLLNCNQTSCSFTHQPSVLWCNCIYIFWHSTWFHRSLEHWNCF